jgi:outer membrane protein assembly factor BamB
MARGRGDMQDVELVELDDDVDPAAHAGPFPRLGADGTDPDDPDLVTGNPAPPRWSPRARARTRNAALALIAVLLVTGAASTVLGRRHDAARLRALADVPGVIAPLSGPVEELWQSDGWPMASLSEVDGRLVTVLSLPAGGSAAVAMDPLTGEVAWRTPLPADSPDGGPMQCVVPGSPWRDVADADPDAAPVLVCVVADEMALADEERTLDGFMYPVRARLVVVDALTGELLADDPVEPPVSLTANGADLVVATVTADGHARITSRDPRSGEVLWTFEPAEPVPVDRFGLRRVWVHTQHDLVVAEGGPVWVLTGSGELVREVAGEADPFGGFTQLVAGGRVLARSPTDADSVTTELVDVDTGRSRSVAGFVGTPQPDDGSLPDLLLVGPGTGGGLSAHDVATGARLWTVEGHDSSMPVVLDGRVLAVDGTSVEALDGRTGAVVWSTPVPRLLASSAIVTDGEVALVTTGVGPDGALVALDLDDGRQVWTTPIDDQPYLFSEEGRLFGYGSTGVVAYGSPADRG